MSRFRPDGLPIIVQCDDFAMPAVFTFERQAPEGRWAPSGGRYRAIKVKRFLVCWREYFTLTATSGMLVNVYHDVLTTHGGSSACTTGRERIQGEITSRRRNLSCEPVH